ncbi:MAG: hypothetical protein EA369_04310 [Bradymonadales bacterium]|nr:MAG: hypothetical protein EA369_04310 [Bradymonadales bacterium]
MIVFGSHGNLQRLPLWKKALFVLLALPFFIALLPLGLYMIYRIRKRMKKIEKEWDELQRRQARQRIEVEVIDIESKPRELGSKHNQSR